MCGAVPPLPQYAFMAWCLVKAQGQLYLYHAVGTNMLREMAVVFKVRTTTSEHAQCPPQLKLSGIFNTDCNCYVHCVCHFLQKFDICKRRTPVRSSSKSKFIVTPIPTLRHKIKQIWQDVRHCFHMTCTLKWGVGYVM
jgi:hypothetical protein